MAAFPNASDLLLEAGVATVPGGTFGAPGHLRLSFEADTVPLEDDCRRIVAALDAQA